MAVPKGFRHSEATKLKMSQAHIGKQVTDEFRAKMSSIIRGRKWSANARRNHWHWQGGITTYERKLYLNLRRIARKAGATGSHTEAQWYALKSRFNFACLGCTRQEPEISLTEDHIMPLSKCGSNDISNIQPLCRSCNSRKHDKLINFIALATIIWT
jgi:5-methylcytosine-specific restriction endonuclease McrA